MKKVLASLLFAALFSVSAAASQPATHGFTADQYITVALEYAGPRTLVGVNTFGPFDKAVLCERGTVAAISQAYQSGAVPKGHLLAATCLHVKIKGPLLRPVVVMTPFQGVPLGYVSIAVEYDTAGVFVGSQPLHASPDAATCKKTNEDVLARNPVAPGKSLLIYCVPIPAMTGQASSEALPPGAQST